MCLIVYWKWKLIKKKRKRKEKATVSFCCWITRISISLMIKKFPRPKNLTKRKAYFSDFIAVFFIFQFCVPIIDEVSPVPPQSMSQFRKISIMIWMIVNRGRYYQMSLCLVDHASHNHIDRIIGTTGADSNLPKLIYHDLNDRQIVCHFGQIWKLGYRDCGWRRNLYALFWP